MFILRKLYKEPEKDSYSESNQIIGDSYNTVVEHNRGWEEAIKEWDAFKHEIYCFIVYNDGNKIIPLYKNQGNYIMTSDGKTFSNLTRHIDKQF